MRKEPALRVVGMTAAATALLLATACGRTPDASGSSQGAELGTRAAAAAPKVTTPKTSETPSTHRRARAAERSHAGDADSSTGAGAKKPQGDRERTVGSGHQENAQAPDRPGQRARHSQVTVLKSLPGPAKQTCSTVGAKRDVRSGNFAAGNFVQARKEFRSTSSGAGDGSTVHLYLIPQDAASMSGVRVHLAPVSGKTEGHTTTSHSVNTANGWQYYSVDLKVPSPGTWRITASSGSNRGCFDVSFPS